MILAALLLLAAAPPRSFTEERALLDRRLETLRRLLPDGPTAPADVATLREAAASARLGLEAAARPPAEAGAVGFVEVDVTTTGRFTDVDRFFRQLAALERPIDVASISLKAGSDELLQASAVVRFPFRPRNAPLPAPPVGARTAFAGVPRPQLQAYLHDQALAVAKSEALTALRRARRNPRLFLSELGAIARDRPVAFTDAALGDHFEVRGLSLGEAKTRELEARFSRGFFQVREFLIARQGACRRFEVKGTSPVAGPDAELPLPAEDPFLQDESPCRVDRDATRAAPVQAGGTGRSARGPLTLRLRDVDLADVGFALHRLTRRSFLVDADVVGRVNVDVTDASLEDVWQALRKNGLRVSEAASLSRISMAGTAGLAPAAQSPPTEGSAAADAPKRAGFELKREGVREILAVMTDIEPALAALGPRGFLGRASLWADDVPVAEMRAALLQSVGLAERVENDRRLLVRPDASEEALVAISGAPPDRRLALKADDVDVVDFELAGIGSAGGGYVAFAYLPTGRLMVYKPGDKLADGLVRTVSATEVELESDEGVIRVPLPATR